MRSNIKQQSSAITLKSYHNPNQKENSLSYRTNWRLLPISQLGIKYGPNFLCTPASIFKHPFVSLHPNQPCQSQQSKPPNDFNLLVDVIKIPSYYNKISPFLRKTTHYTKQLKKSCPHFTDKFAMKKNVIYIFFIIFS